MNFDHDRLQVIAKLNRENANNIVAAKLLPAEWRCTASLSVLSLAWWGIEKGISVETPDREVSMDAVEATLLAMDELHPECAMRIAEGSNGIDEVGFNLIDAETAEQGASWVLETIRAWIEDRYG